MYEIERRDTETRIEGLKEVTLGLDIEVQQDWGI